MALSIIFIGKVEIGVAETQCLGKQNLEDKISQEVLQPPKLKKRKLMDHETDETKHLSTTELQRLVLLEQLKLIRLQTDKLQSGILLNISDESII